MRGLLRNFGLKVGTISRGRYDHRIRELAEGNPMLEAATWPMPRARASLRQELAGLERCVRQLAQDDPVCRRLMSMPPSRAIAEQCLAGQRGSARLSRQAINPPLMIPLNSRHPNRSGHGSA